MESADKCLLDNLADILPGLDQRTDQTVYFLLITVVERAKSALRAFQGQRDQLCVIFLPCKGLLGHNTPVEFLDGNPERLFKKSAAAAGYQRTFFAAFFPYSVCG